MTEQLRCQKLMQICDGYDRHGKRWYHHERCDAPAHEIEVKGLLTSAKAVLCEQHRLQAEREAFVSKKGYDLGHMPIKPKKSDSLSLPFRK